MASGEYDRRKEKGIMPGIDQIARLHGISPRTLRNYRANYLSRKHERKAS